MTLAIEFVPLSALGEQRKSKPVEINWTASTNVNEPDYDPESSVHTGQSLAATLDAALLRALDYSNARIVITTDAGLLVIPADILAEIWREYEYT